MKLIDTKKQLLINIQTVENYLDNGTDWEQIEMKRLIANGRCFVAYKVAKQIKFAPSRFLGYVSNTLKKHYDARDKHQVDGKDTNPMISRGLGQRLVHSDDFEKKYLAYCENLGATPANHKNRKYWSLI